MKNIHFDDLANNLFLKALSFISFALLAMGILGVFFSNDPELYKRVAISGMFLNLLYYSRMYWFKNYVQWNKKGAVIRLNNAMFGNSIKFSDVESVQIEDEVLFINHENGRVLEYDLTDFETENHKELKDLLTLNTSTSEE